MNTRSKSPQSQEMGETSSKTDVVFGGDQDRLIGRAQGSGQGPKVVVVAGLHGNEPAGILAVRRVLDRIEAESLPVRGRILALRGNRRALAEKKRYLERDLNRQWTARRVERLRTGPLAEDASPEDLELRELLEAVEGELLPADSDGYFLDLHTTSATGVPFILFGDTLRNRKFASKVPLPIILGLEEQLDGTLLEYVNRLGFITIGCEGGQHDAPDSIDNHEALIWLTIHHAGGIELSKADLALYENRLRAVRGTVPEIIEVRYRHAVDAEDCFRMKPGFTNFDPVEAGQLLARDIKGEVRSRWRGWLLMPLYQGQGADGFFLASEVKAFWLTISALVRRLRLGFLLRLLPGVSPHADRGDSLVVDTRVARWFPLEIFHLFGFRKLRWSGPILVVSRRPYDLEPPW